MARPCGDFHVLARQVIGSPVPAHEKHRFPPFHDDSGTAHMDVAAEITGHSRIGTLCIRLAGIRWKQSSVIQQPMADRTPTIGADRD